MTKSPDFEITPRDLAQINEDQQTVENVATLQRRGGVEWLLKVLKTHRENGISSSELEARRKLFGSNKLDDIPPESWLSIFFASFNDATLIVLIVSALVSLVIGIYEDPKKGWVEGAAILTAVFAVAIVTATNDYSKDQQFRALNKVKEDIRVTVRRDGKVDQVSIYDVVVGDVIEMNSGDKVPCDGVLVEAYEVSANESSLTGESDDVNKGPEDVFLLSGCQLTGGSGKIVAIAVGKESRWGRIRDKLEQETGETPLQEKLDDMANFIGYVGMGAAAATFVAIVGMWWWNKDEKSVPLFDTVLKAFIMAVTIVVVAVPEGLPLAVTISLAYSTKKMLRDNNLIRHLAACETMGNATTICSDKTGTLTENRMTVTQCWLPGQSQMSSPPPQLQSGPVRDLLTEGIALNTTANLLKTAAPNGGIIKGEKTRCSITTVLGNKTEGALLMLIDKWATDFEAVRAGKKGQYRIHPFSSRRKMMSVLVRKSATSQQQTLYVKGAAEILVVQCTKELRADGTVAPMTVERRKQLQDIITDMAKQSLRAVSLAHRSVEGDVEDMEALEKDLTLDAIVGITDPLRPEVVEAVRTCQRAGIMVRMVTGDNVETAKAVARQCGILKKTGTVLEGPSFRNLTPAQLDKVLPTLQVLARSSPDDKHTLVARLNGSLPEKRADWEKHHPGRSWDRERDSLLPGYMGEWTTSRRHGLGEVVGVTGDGTNDAPALRVADVGLSMGISGTEVAKEASDIVILDDNFASIVKAVLWGRSVFDNIRKFLQFQLTVNVVALTLTFLSAVSGYDPPLNAVMMLWVNLIMDTMGALALGTEAPDPRLLTRQPYKRNASLISRPMWRNILVQSAFQIAVLVLLLLRADEVLRMVSSAAFMLPPIGDAIAPVEHGSVRHMTIIFNAFVFCQIFNEFNARSIGDDANILRGLRKNPMFMAIIAFTTIVQFLIIQFGGDFTKTEPLTYAEWKVTVIIGLCALPLGNAMRLIPIHENPANFAGTAVMEEENIEPEERPHVKHRTRLYKIFVRTLRVLVLLILPVLFAMCYKKPEACRGIHFLEYWKF